MFVTDFGIRILVGTCIGEAYLQVRIGNLTVRHHFKVLEYLHISLVRVHDNVKIFIGAKHLCEYIAERLLQHTNHGGFVNILQFFELVKMRHHIRCLFFLSHFGVGMVLNYLKSI